MKHLSLFYLPFIKMSNNKIHYCQLDKHEAMSEHAIWEKYLTEIPKLYERYKMTNKNYALNREEFKRLRNELLIILNPLHNKCKHCCELTYSDVLSNGFDIGYISKTDDQITIVDKMCIELHLKLNHVLDFESFYEYEFRGEIQSRFVKFCCRCNEYINIYSTVLN